MVHVVYDIALLFTMHMCTFFSVPVLVFMSAVLKDF